MFAFLLMACGSVPECDGEIALVPGTNRATISVGGVSDLTVIVQTTSSVFEAAEDTLVLSTDGGSGVLPWLPYGTSVTIRYTGTRDEDGQVCGGEATLDTPAIPEAHPLRPPAVGQRSDAAGDDSGYALLVYNAPSQQKSDSQANAVALVELDTGALVGLRWVTADELPEDATGIHEALDASEQLGSLSVIGADHADGVVYLVTNGSPADPERGGQARASFVLGIDPSGQWLADDSGATWYRALAAPAHHNMVIDGRTLYYPSYAVRQPYTDTCQLLVTSPTVRSFALDSGEDGLLFDGQHLLEDPEALGSFKDESDCELFCDASGPPCTIKLSHGGLFDYLNAIGVEDGTLWGTASGMRVSTFSFPLSSAGEVQQGDCSSVTALVNPGRSFWGAGCNEVPIDADEPLLEHPHYQAGGIVLDLNREETSDNPGRSISLTRFSDDGGVAAREVLARWDSTRHSSLSTTADGGLLMAVSDMGCLVGLDAGMGARMWMCPDLDGEPLDSVGAMRLRWGRAISTAELWAGAGWGVVP